MSLYAYGEPGGDARLAELRSRLKRLAADCAALYGEDLAVSAETCPPGSGMTEAHLVCRVPRDVFRLTRLLLAQTGVTLVSRKADLPAPGAPFGLRLIVKLPVPWGTSARSAPFVIVITAQKADFRKWRS